MSFSDRIRRIHMEDQEYDVPEDATASEIIRGTGQDPKNRSLVKTRQDGSTTIYRPNDRPRLRDGERFETQVAVKGGC